MKTNVCLHFSLRRALLGGHRICVCNPLLSLLSSYNKCMNVRFCVFKNDLAKFKMII